MIVKRSGGYGVRVYNPATGRKEWVGTYPRLGTVREEGTARWAEADAAARFATRVRRITVKDFSQEWLHDKANAPRNAWAPTTLATNTYMIAPFVDEYGHIPIADLGRAEAASFSLQHPVHLPVCRAMVNWAIHKGARTAVNPFSNLARDLGITQSRGRKDLPDDWLTTDQVNKLAETARGTHAHGDMIAAAITFAAYVGLRPGEMFALEWDDLDLKNNEVKIGWQVAAAGGRRRPKNKLARTVILPPQAADAVQTLTRRLDVPWVFWTVRGKRFARPSFYTYWTPARAAFGRPDMDFYELRHFCATHLLSMGVTHEDVAVQLGHTDGGELVRSTYGHPSLAAARERLKAAYRLARPGWDAKGTQNVASPTVFQEVRVP